MLPLTTMKPMALVIAGTSRLLFGKLLYQHCEHKGEPLMICLYFTVPVLNLVEYHPERGDASSLFVETTYMHHHSEVVFVFDTEMLLCSLSHLLLTYIMFPIF
jgi:hypothetical protein